MPENIVVINTTPLIALADVGLLDLLHKLFGEVYIPQAVLHEIKSEPARSQVRASDWIRVEKIKHESNKAMFKAKLHSGEVEVMILAEELGADLLIMDDNAAKKTAKFMGFDVAGTLGILVTAKENGYIDNVKSIMARMSEDGMYISDNVKNTVLRMAGE